MNSNLKVLLGALVGAGVGYFVGGVIVEIINLKQNPWEENYYDDDGLGDGDEFPKMGEPEVMNKNVLKTKRVKNYSQYFKDRPDIAALAAKYNGEAIEPLSGDEEKDKEMVLEELAEFTIIEDEAEKTDPSIISMSEFANAGDDYECLTLNYYDDDVVTDENDNPIDRPEQILGTEALVSFGELSDDEDVVYVRNEKKKAMYEVIRTNKEYAAQRSRRATKEKMLRRGKAPIDFDEKEEENGEDNIT